MEGLLSCRWGPSWPGGLQGGPAECELLGTTSILEAIGDMTTSSPSQLGMEFPGPQSGSRSDMGVPGIVKIPLILGCAGSPPSVLTLASQALTLLSASFGLLALLVLFCSIYWLNPTFLLISEIPGRYAWLRQRLHPHHQRHHDQPGPAVDGTAHGDHLHVQPVPPFAPL